MSHDRAKILANKDGWFRISLIAVVVWAGIVTLIVSTNRRMDWFNHRGNPEEGFWLFIIGGACLFIVCNGVPWVMAAFGETVPSTRRTDASLRDDEGM